ncbi:MAG: Type leader peptidase family protein [Gemmataceae bacterium]|nr:Type leader peptidase family protein [Gemmataceae bacterium]
MANDVLTPRPAPAGSPVPAADSLGIDRAFVMQMARMPALALIWVAAAFAAHQVWAAVAPGEINYGPLVVICAGMVLAAVVDGWALKVPNWVTLPLVLSGWLLGLLHDCGVAVDAGTGGVGLAVLGTGLGFLLLFPMLVIRGVGEGDVKMQMGFGAWAGAYFGPTGPTGLHGLGVVFWAFSFGAIVGGVFGLIMILLRRQFGKNASTVGEILKDLQLFASGSPMEAARRAEARRDRWVKLPYGIPLCVGFVLYLWYMLGLSG